MLCEKHAVKDNKLMNFTQLKRSWTLIKKIHIKINIGIQLLSENEAF